MGDDTKELLNAHHAAILRELDTFQRNVRSDMSDIKSDMSNARTRLDVHTTEDSARFSELTRGIGILQWAYGVGVLIIGALLAKMGWQ